MGEQNKTKKKRVKLIKTDKAKEFDYEGILGVPNPYDRGRFRVKGNVSNLNRKTKKKYIDLYKQLGMGDIEYEINKAQKKEQKKKKQRKMTEGTMYVNKLYGGIVGK